jgi:hypothetical protein
MGGYLLYASFRPAEMKIRSHKISEERENFFENKERETELEFVTPNTVATTGNGFTLNTSLKTNTDVTNEVPSNTYTEEASSQYLDNIPTQNTSTNTEADEPANDGFLNSSSAYGPGAENASVVPEGNDTHADDDHPVSPNPYTTTSTTTQPTECSDACIAQDQYGLSWTGCPGSYVIRPCPNQASGEAKWLCSPNGNSFLGDMPNYTNCTHVWIEAVQEEVSCSYYLSTLLQIFTELSCVAVT